jgi:hypothetical protein
MTYRQKSSATPTTKQPQAQQGTSQQGQRRRLRNGGGRDVANLQRVEDRIGGYGTQTDRLGCAVGGERAGHVLGNRGRARALSGAGQIDRARTVLEPVVEGGRPVRVPDSLENLQEIGFTRCQAADDDRGRPRRTNVATPRQRLIGRRRPPRNNCARSLLSGLLRLGRSEADDP